MKTTGRPEWVLPPVCKCHNTPLPLWCDACMSIRGPLLNCAADNRRLSGTRVNTLHNLLKDHFKKASLHEVTWCGMRVICPHRRMNLDPSALVSSGRGTLLGRRYDTLSLHSGLDISQGRGQALRLRRQSGAVNGCLSWQITLNPCCLNDPQLTSVFGFFYVV